MHSKIAIQSGFAYVELKISSLVPRLSHPVVFTVSDQKLDSGKAKARKSDINITHIIKLPGVIKIVLTSH